MLKSKLGRRALLALALGLATAGAFAQAPAKYVENRDYMRIDPAQPVAAGGKVEVIEFFWYGCPHCYRLQKPWEKWLAVNGSAIDYHAQPAVLGKSWEIMARAYHAMIDAGGFDRDLHEKIFVAIHEKSLPLQTLDGDEPKNLYAFVAKEKGDAYAAKFKQSYSGFAMGPKIAKDRDLQKLYKLEGTPTIVVAGKYAVNPSTAGSEEAIVPIVDYLVKKAQGEMKK